jgi:hypothetical protein
VLVIGSAVVSRSVPTDATLAVGADGYDGSALSSVHVYRYGSDGQWFEPGSVLIAKSEDESFGWSLALSGDASILVASGSGLLSFFEADGDEWIEVGKEATGSDSLDWNAASISRDGSTAMSGASVFDFSCQQETTPDTTTSIGGDTEEPTSIGVIVGASIGGAAFLAIAVFMGIRVKKPKEDAEESMMAVQRPSTKHTGGVSRSNGCTAVKFPGGVSRSKSTTSSGVIVYDVQGEVLAPRTVAAPAVLLESDNPTSLQKNTAKV